MRVRASDCQGVEAPWPLALAQKSTRQKYQGPDDAKIWRIPQGDRSRGTGETEGLATGEPPRGRQGPGRRLRMSKRGGYIVAGNGDRFRDAARGAGTSGGG